MISLILLILKKTVALCQKNTILFLVLYKSIRKLKEKVSELEMSGLPFKYEIDSFRGKFVEEMITTIGRNVFQ